MAEMARDDYLERLRSYHRFIRGLRLVVAGLAALLLMLAFFLL